jgi:hypothetical protein
MNKEKTDRFIFNSVILVLGILIFIAGLLMTYSKMSGNRWGNVVYGIRSQIGGIFFICFGLYIIIISIKKFVHKN